MKRSSRRKQQRKCQNDEKSESTREQRAAILTCLAQEPVDVITLQKLAFNRRGFLSHALRRRVWPHLLHVTPHYQPRYTVQPHPCDAILQRDINRSLYHYSCVRHLTPTQRDKKRVILFNVINAVLNHSSELHYYQGFHDICSVFLLVQSRPADAYRMISRVSTSYLKEVMNCDFDVVMQVLHLLFPLIRLADPELAAFLDASTVEPYVALPWIITWFAHHLDDLEQLARLYDVLLSSHPLFALYCSAALILRHAPQIGAVECEFATVHSLLASLPQNMQVEPLIQTAQQLLQNFPPETLLPQITLAKDNCFRQYPYAYQPKRRTGMGGSYRTGILAGLLLALLVLIGLLLLLKFLVKERLATDWTEAAAFNPFV